MPLTRTQRLSGATAWSDSFIQPTPSQLKAQLQALDLDNYVPLGSFEANTAYILKDVTKHTATVTEFTDNPSSLLSGNQALAENLNLLLIHHWIRIFLAKPADSVASVIRIYVLPDDVARGLIVRDSAKLRSALRTVIALINCSASAWNGKPTSEPHTSYITPADATDSLYYLFNNVSSPQPDPEILDRDANYYAMQDILNNSMSLGLKTLPYDYQQRSAASMLSREAEPQYHVDPRFEQRRGPTGEAFYLDCVEGTIVKEAKSYEDVRGGILAENMGSGKTYISLLLILSTQGHSIRLPESGVSSSSFQPDINRKGSLPLKEIAAKAIRQHGLAYRSALQRAGEPLVEYMDKTRAWYVPPGSTEKIYLSSTTLIVVPSNLIAHWTDEIKKHIQQHQLSVYTSTNGNDDLLPLHELLSYDIIMLSKTRFEDEFNPRQSNKRRRDEDEDENGGLICVCDRKRRACAKHGYSTPLANIHFLRIIVDEALGFSKTAFDNKASAALEKVIAERKWLVSGTPSKGLRGVEVDIAMNQDKATSEGVFEQQTLEERRARPTMDTEEEQVKHFGRIVTNFFRAKPWSNKGHGSIADRASWARYMIPDKYGKGKPGNLQAVVESLVVRHQIHEVLNEVALPPLSNHVVYLDACPVDKIALNLFTVQLVINAITSEREDQDYMFHPKQKTALANLFQNLRRANFYWTGLNHENLLKTLETAERYAAKDTTNMSPDDAELLEEALAIGHSALSNIQWQTLSTTHEMGLFVEDFPSHLREKWSLAPAGYRQPLLLGATMLRNTQNELIPKMYASNPYETLWRSEGDEVWRSAVVSSDTGIEKKSKVTNVKGISQSTYDTKDASPTKRRKSQNAKATDHTQSLLPRIPSSTKLKSAMKRTSPGLVALPEAYSELSKPKLIATSSTKLSYLLDKIMEVQKDEKSIIFYEDDNTGFWLAQALEILEVRHEIYATGIKEGLRAEYLHKFENEEDIRVLLMHLKLGSHGLHLASATRIFFVNPVWDETVEAQAIKRAHRTGQSKPVYIETLVLRGTLEDQMLQRRKNMTSQELQQTAKGPTSDPQMHEIIKNASFLPMSDEEWNLESLQCAPLKQSYQIYAREFIGHPSLLAQHSRSASSTAENDRPSPPRTIRFDNCPRRPCEEWSGSVDHSAVIKDNQSSLIGVQSKPSSTSLSFAEISASHSKAASDMAETLRSNQQQQSVVSRLGQEINLNRPIEVLEPQADEQPMKKRRTIAWAD